MNNFLERLIKDWYSICTMARNSIVSVFIAGVLFAAWKFIETQFIIKQLKLDFNEHHLYHQPFEFLAFLCVVFMYFWVKEVARQERIRKSEFEQWLTHFKDVKKRALFFEKRFRQIIDNSPMGVLLFELNDLDELIFTGANPAADKILGNDLTKLLKKKIHDAFPATEESILPKKYIEVAKGERETWSASDVVYKNHSIKGVFGVMAFSTGPRRVAVFFTRVREQRIGDLLRKDGVPDSVIEDAASRQSNDNVCFCTVPTDPVNNE